MFNTKSDDVISTQLKGALEPTPKKSLASYPLAVLPKVKLAPFREIERHVAAVERVIVHAELVGKTRQRDENVCCCDDNTAGKPLNNTPTLKKAPSDKAACCVKVTPAYVTDASPLPK